MTMLPTPSQLAALQDDELERLAVDWRARAGRGERQAFGIAQVLEVEHRRRLRDSQLQALPAAVPVPPPTRAWWKFWRSSEDDAPMSAP